MSSGDELNEMRHSLAHIMAGAMQKIWHDTQFGIGPTTNDGFYYDVKIPGYLLNEDDLPKIEEEMNAIIKKAFPFERYELDIEEAIKWAEDSKQPFKVELLNDLKRSGTTLASELTSEEMGSISDSATQVETVSFYKSGDFTDLCRGPHVFATDKVGAFKLMRISGAYWRGDINKEQLQRVYGVAFKDKKDLEEHLKNLEEARARDHRRLGKELDLFVISDLVGPGLPLFTPRGTVLRNELIAFSEELQVQGGYEEVWAPHITRTELYKLSGHYDKYPERFEATSMETDDVFMLKPMNCPHVAQIFASRPRSYRDMPQRYMETATMYRDEKSGELHGLSRVRALTQDDSHAFARQDQIEDEFRSILSMVKQMYKVLDMPLSVDLSFRDDSDKYYGEKELWNDAESRIEKIAKEQDLDYQVVRGEAAFYGPKIDIYVLDALGRKWQCATVQLDYIQPQRFDLKYTDVDGSEQCPVMIHKAILGSIERFLSVYIEHTAGKFPLWIAPEQLRIITINQEDSTLKYARDILKRAKLVGLRAYLDDDNEPVGKKIRKAETMKVPYSIVIGPKEIDSGMVVPRIRTDLTDKEAYKPISISDFINSLTNEAKSRTTRSSL